MRTTRQPILNATVLIELITAGVVMLMTFGYLRWSEGELNAFLAFLAVMVPALITGFGTYFASRNKVTPMADPRTAEGEPAMIVPLKNPQVGT